MDDLDTLKRKLGTALLAAREKAGLTQADVSSQVGIATAIYGRIERGQMLPSVPTLHRLCSTLHLSASALLGLGSEGVEEGDSSREETEALSAELLHLFELLRQLSPAELRCLAALASDIWRTRGYGKRTPPED
ncbi:MAG: helix-turn-helix transcriptional regulator [Cystobacter sp.]